MRILSLIFAFTIAGIATTTAQQGYPHIIAGPAQKRAFESLDPIVQNGIRAAGLEINEGRECVVFAVAPRLTPWGFAIDNHPSGPPGRGFSIGDLYSLRLWDRARDWPNSILEYHFSPSWKDGNANARLYNKDQVDASDAYTIWISEKRSYPNFVTGLDWGIKRLRYGKPHEQLWEIQNYTRASASKEALADIVHTCLAKLPTSPNDCFCVGTQRNEMRVSRRKRTRR
jgi:hypothetical protein